MEAATLGGGFWSCGAGSRLAPQVLVCPKYLRSLPGAPPLASLAMIERCQNFLAPAALFWNFEARNICVPCLHRRDFPVPGELLSWQSGV